MTGGEEEYEKPESRLCSSRLFSGKNWIRAGTAVVVPSTNRHGKKSATVICGESWSWQDEEDASDGAAEFASAAPGSSVEDTTNGRAALLRTQEETCKGSVVTAHACRRL